MKNWIRLAFKEAKKGRHSQFLVGAVVIKGGAIISKGSNLSRPYGLDNRGFHAEERALKGHTDYSGATIIIACTTLNGNTHISKPCPWCMQKIREKRIAKIIYIDRKGDLCIERVKNMTEPCYN